jgi:hypothetical protein
VVIVVELGREEHDSIPATEIQRGWNHITDSRIKLNENIINKQIISVYIRIKFEINNVKSLL